MMVFDSPPSVVESARDREERIRSETEDRWAARLDALEAARAPRTLDVSCVYCGRESGCRCAASWEADACRCGDDWWD